MARMLQRRNWPSQRKQRRHAFRSVGMGAYEDGLQVTKGGIFRHEGPHYPYESLSTSAYNDGALGQEDLELAEGMRRLTIVVGCTGLLVAGILFNQVLIQARR